MYDVAIIGAGVSGCSVARELSRYDARVVVLEREDDVCCGTSKANSAIVHAGFDAEPGSLMARFNAEGNRMMPALCDELGVEFDNIGSLVVCTSEESLPGLESLLERGRKNGIEGLRIVYRDELVQMEPNISDAAIAALWAPTAGIVNPFQLTFSLADCAAVNGVEFRFDCKVTGVAPKGDGWVITTESGEVEARTVVNAAGVYADELHRAARVGELIGSKNPTEIQRAMKKTDLARRSYYQSFTGKKWGECRNYNLALDSGMLGYDACVKLIVDAARAVNGASAE